MFVFIISYASSVHMWVWFTWIVCIMWTFVLNKLLLLVLLLSVFNQTSKFHWN